MSASSGEPSGSEICPICGGAAERGYLYSGGGIVGMVQLDDCVTSSTSKWFEGPIGWVLSKPKRLQFIPLKGRLGLFDPPKEIIQQLSAT